MHVGLLRKDGDDGCDAEKDGDDGCERGDDSDDAGG